MTESSKRAEWAQLYSPVDQNLETTTKRAVDQNLEATAKEAMDQNLEATTFWIISGRPRPSADGFTPQALQPKPAAYHLKPQDARSPTQPEQHQVIRTTWVPRP